MKSFSWIGKYFLTFFGLYGIMFMSWTSLLIKKGVFNVRLIIAGGRDFKNYELLKDKVKFYTKNNEDITIISGTANGADRLGEKYANENGIDLEYYPANWNKFGKSAGYIRNKEMAKTATHLIAFWDGKSKGTKHMINLAKEYNLDYRIVRYE